jgi:hypothetical protein
MDSKENSVLCEFFGVATLDQVSKREALSAVFVLRLANIEMMLDLFYDNPTHPRFEHLTNEQRREIEIAAIERAKAQAVTL